MRQLPCTGNTQDAQLNQRPAHDLCIGRLALVTEFGLSFLKVASKLAFAGKLDLVKSGVAYPLEYLLAADVRQPAIQLLDLRDDTVNLGLVLALDLTRLADGQVHRQLDTATGDARAGEPASHADGRRPRRSEA